MAEDKRLVIWSPEAEEDALHIWRELARRASVEVADRQIREFNRTCERLSEWPYSGLSVETCCPDFVRSPSIHTCFFIA